MTESARHSVSVAAAVTRDDGRVLAIQRRDNGRWEPPGGVLEHGETIAEGLRREVAEETGVVITDEYLTGVYQNMNVGVVALVFRCTVASGQPRRSDEARAVAWLDADEIRNRMTDAYAVRILDALNPPVDGPAIRAHDGTHLLTGVLPSLAL